MLDTKTIAKLACCMVLVLGFGAAAVVAQQPGASAARKPGDLDEIRKVSSLIGSDVMNRANTKIAVLRDLLLNPDGAIMYAVLGYDGVAGVGETYTAVPFDLMGVRHEEGKWAANLDMTADDLKKAPAIKSENYRELTDPQWIARINQFIRDRGESQQPERRIDAAKREQGAVRHVLLATKFRATSLKNVQNEHLGKIEELLLDRMYRVAFVIVGRGGVLGIGEKFVPVPWSRLGLGATAETAAVTVTIDARKPQFDAAPLVKGGDYATLLAPGFAEEVRHYFGTAGREGTAGANQNQQ